MKKRIFILLIILLFLNINFVSGFSLVDFFGEKIKNFDEENLITGKVISTQNLLLQAHLDESAAPLKNSVNNNDITSSGITFSEQGILNKAVKFPGGRLPTDGFISPKTQLPGSWTIAFWMNVKGMPADWPWSNFIEGNNGQKFYLFDSTDQRSDNTLSIHWFILGKEDDFATLNYNQWYFITAKYDGTTLTAFAYDLNGNIVGTKSTAGTSGWSLTDINKIGYFDGFMDEIYIYGRELSNSEITSLYNDLKTGATTPSTPPATTPSTTTVGGTLTVTTSGPGKITGTGINCGETYILGIFDRRLTDCSETYTETTTITLTETTNDRSTFSGWSGDCSGTSQTCSVTMNGDKNVNANFVSAAVAATPATSTTSSCPDDQTLFKMSADTNAHAALWNNNDYAARACANNLNIEDRTCNAGDSDLIIKLSSDANAHVEKPGATRTSSTVFGQTLKVEAEDRAVTKSAGLELFTNNGITFVRQFLHGSYLQYSYNAPTTGNYDVDVRVGSDATGSSGNIRMKIYVDGTSKGVVTVPNTGGYENFQTITIENVEMAQGARTIKLEMIQAGSAGGSGTYGFMTADWFNFKERLTINPSEYNVKVCSEDLACEYKNSCDADEVCVASISADTNAHVGLCDSYATKLCCEPSRCNLKNCQGRTCNAPDLCRTGGCKWDTTVVPGTGINGCCEPGKKFDTAAQKCIYDPNGVTVILDLDDANTDYLDHADFAYKGKLHSLTFDGLFSAETAIVTVSSLPQTETLKAKSTGEFRDFDLNNDGTDDLRVVLDKIITFNSGREKASFIYLISDNGLCGGVSGGASTTTTTSTSTSSTNPASTTLTIEIESRTSIRGSGTQLPPVIQTLKTCTITSTNLNCETNELWEDMAAEDVGVSIKAKIASNNDYRLDSILIGNNIVKTCADTLECSVGPSITEQGNIKVRTVLKSGTSTSSALPAAGNPDAIKIEAEDSSKVQLVNNRNDVINGQQWDIQTFTAQGVSGVRFILDQDKFIINFGSPVSGTYSLGVNAHRAAGSAQPKPQILIKSGTTNLGSVDIGATAFSSTRTFTWNEFKSGNFNLNNARTLELVVNANGDVISNFNDGLFYVDWFKFTSVGTASTSTNLCSGNSASSICNYGNAYCTIGTTCNWYPPNANPSEGGCCPERQKWNKRTGVCEDFADPSATCLNFNSFRDFNTGDSIKYDEVCCQVSVGYGFWDPAKTYTP